MVESKENIFKKSSILDVWQGFKYALASYNALCKITQGAEAAIGDVL